MQRVPQRGRVPLIAVAVLAYAAGLLAAFAGRADAAVAAAGVAMLAGAWRGGSRTALAAAACAAGALVAAVSDRHAARCAAALRHRHAWVVRLERAAQPGDVGAGWTAGRCRLRVMVLASAGRAAPGALAAVVGDAVAGRTPRGEPSLQIRDAAVRELSPPPARWRARERVARIVDRRFGAHAPLVRALVVADQRGIPDAERERFAAAGIAHMLSVSGLHVGLVSLMLALVLEAARLSRPWVTAMGVVAVGAYVIAIGAPPPAVRAAVMLAALAASRLAQRPTSSWAILALGALLPLYEPRVVLDVGYQLSVLGVAALCAAGALDRRITGWTGLPEAVRGSGPTRTARVALLGSTVATVASMPLVAWHFGVVSLVAPLTNLAAAPLMALLQPTLFLTLALEPLPALATTAASAAAPMLSTFGWIADVGASLPGARIPAALSWWTLPLALGAVLALLGACVARHPGRWLAAGAAALSALAWMPASGPPFPGGTGTELHLLDVGQGDAVAVRSRRGRWILFDAGRVWRSGDAGRATIVPYIRRRGGRLATFVLSHPHADHVGGAATVLRALRPERYVDAAFAGGGDAYRASLRAARELGVRWTRVRPGDSLVVDEVVVRFLAPDSGWTAGLDDPNEASTVALVRVGQVRFLLTGDAERAEEAWLLARDRGELRADVLKVAHHGSRTSSTDAWLDAVRPRIALVSVGEGNGYGHPSADRMRALAGRGALVLRTDRLGTIVLRTDGVGLAIDAGGDRWESWNSSSHSAGR